MAGRPHKIRAIKSYINNIDAHTFAGPMKSGTSPSIGVTHNFWHRYQSQCNQNPNQIKKSYANMVFLNINPAQTAVTAGFRPTTNYNYSYTPPNSSVAFYDANAKYDNHFYRPYAPPATVTTGKFINPSMHMTGFPSSQGHA
jgi:hypothetical protein